MRKHSLARAGVVVIATALWWSSASAQPGPTQAGNQSSLTLDMALRIAESNSATLRATQAQLDAAQGARKEAQAPLFNNPQVSVDRTRREVPQSGVPTERRREWGAGVTQTLEIAGQQGLRRDASGAALTAVQEDSYEQRAVELGDKLSGRTVVKSGLTVGEQVVAAGTYALKARVLKSQIGDEH